MRWLQLAKEAKKKEEVSALRNFLADLETRADASPDQYLDALDAEVWRETDCLSCAGCCRNMSPVFTVTDTKRIATHLRMTVAAFREKWLYKADNGNWMNRLQPCPFLELKTNKCSIYAIRPEDCASFPHLTKKPMLDYLHVHRQNVAYCPATVRLVEKLMDKIEPT